MYVYIYIDIYYILYKLYVSILDLLIHKHYTFQLYNWILSYFTF